jgi:hypothetical protein
MQEFLAWWPAFWQQWHTLIRIVLILVGTVLVRWILLISVSRVVKQIEAGTRGKFGQSDERAVHHSPVAKARVIQRAKTLA